MGLPYVGRAPDSDSSITTKQYVDTKYGTVAVDLDYVNSAAADIASDLVLQTYVDTQDNTRAKKTLVDTADASYILATQRGVANGVASIGSDGFIPSGQIPSGIPDRAPIFVNYTTKLLSSQSVVTTATKEYLAATIEVADPGFPYYPLIFGSVTGSSGSTQGQVRRANSGGLGKMVVLTASDQIWAAGVAGGSYQPAQYEIQPSCNPNATPSTQLPLSGANTFTLWLSCFTGNSYQFTDENFSYYAILFPGV